MFNEKLKEGYLASSQKYIRRMDNVPWFVTWENHVLHVVETFEHPFELSLTIDVN